MENLNDFSPKLDKELFICISCKAVSRHDWRELRYFNGTHVTFGVKVSICHCGYHMLWVADKLVHPRILTVDPPHEDMPEGVKSLYLEAARVLPDSARAAAVLIRVALQELLNHMGKSTGNLAKDIENLAKEGFDEHVIMAFNLVRLLGNDGAHPNQLMLGQTIDDAGQLFFLLNYITNTQCDRLRDRARVKELSEAIPEDVQMKIDVRHNGS